MKIFTVFDNIKLPSKMGFIGALALLALSLPTYYYTQQSIQNQRLSETELQGIQPASMVVHLRKVLAEHRGLSSVFLSGDSSKAADLSAKAREVDAQLSKIDVTIESSTANDAFSSKINTLKRAWEQVKNQAANRQLAPLESATLHSELIQQGDMIIAEMSKFFLLSYDPSAASNHAIIASFKDAPRLANSLGMVRGVSSGILAAEGDAIAEKAALRGFINNIQSPLQDLKYNMQSAVDADERFAKQAQDSVKLASTIDRLLIIAKTEVLDKNVRTYDSNAFFTEYTNTINNIYALHNSNVALLTAVIEERAASIAANRTTTLTIIAIALLISCLFSVAIVSSLKKASNTVVNIFAEISKGNFNTHFNTDRKDEMGIIEAELSTLNEQLKASADIAIEATKIKQALDKSTMCFMLSNADREIVYMNESVHKLMKACEADIRKELPQFNADTLIGTRIDSFHHNPAHQHKVLDDLKTVHTARLSLGGYSFQLNINPIRDENGNDLGNSVEWIDMTEIFEEERRVTRIIEALDSASTNVMIANDKREIIYLNKSVKDMLKKVEPELKKVLPQFDADDIIGKNMDIFHRDPSHQKALLERLNETFVAQITVGTQHFRLTANPIKSSKGERIGTVVEWLDRTKEINAEKEIAKIVTSSLAGDFSQRIDEQGKEDFLLVLAQGLNQLISTTESGLNEVSNVLLALSEGDLTQRITKDYQGTFDDLKNYANSTSTNLAEMIGKIREASQTISNASSEIAAGNSDLSTRTEQQASSLEETASSMEELTSTVRLNAENAVQANGLASKASEVAGNGGALIEQVVLTMNSINESSQKIYDIIGVIDGIAFQTNILALNAAVEAARAGEQGRGFAVVASEVRTLAQRSANAAKDIKDLISDSVSKVSSGNMLVSQSGDTMQEIVVSIKRVNDIMSDIAAASAEQASGIDEVSKAVIQMDEMTQQNAALVEEAAAAAESMRAQASDLTTRVGTFKLDASDGQSARLASASGSSPNSYNNNLQNSSDFEKNELQT